MMRKTIPFLLAVAMLGVTGAALGGPKKVTPPPAAPSSVLEVLQGLSTNAALNQASVQTALDVYLATDKDRSNQFFSMFSGKPRGGSVFEASIALVDFRAPQQGAKGPFLLVEFRPGAAPSVADLVGRFGRPDEVRAQPPPNPVPVLYVYQSVLGPVRFGVSSDQKQVLSAAIDRAE